MTHTGEAPKSISHTADRKQEIERRDFISSFGLIFALFALVLVMVDVGGILLMQLGIIYALWWPFLAKSIIPQVAVIVGAAAVGMHLVDTWHLIARHRAFDPRETQRDLAIDDLAALLSRLQQGCAVRVVLPFSLSAALLAFLVGLLWVAPNFDAFEVTADNVPHICSATFTLAPFILHLDNAASTVSVSWSAQPIENLPSGVSWAQIQPSQGSLAAGQQQEIKVYANALACYYATASGSADHAGGGFLTDMVPTMTTFHVRVTINGREERQRVLAMSVIDDFPGGTPTPTSVPLSPTPTVPTVPSPTATPPNHKSTPTPTAHVFSPTPTPTIAPSPTPTATPTPTTPPCQPNLQDSITAPPNGSTYETSGVVSITFTGTYSGNCIAIPSQDITWWYTLNGTTIFMGYGTSITYSLMYSSYTYQIQFMVTDPSIPSTVNAYISITVLQFIP